MQSKHLFIGLQVLSALSAFSGVGLAIANLHYDDPLLTTAQPLCNYIALGLLATSGIYIDLKLTNRIKAERVIAIAALSMAIVMLILKLNQLPSTHIYPSLDTMSIGAVLLVFGLMRVESASVDLFNAIGRRNLTGFVISGFGLTIQLLSAMAIKNPELIPIISKIFLGAVTTVVVSDLHKVLPNSRNQITHYLSWTTTLCLVAAFTCLILNQPPAAAISAVIGFFILMHNQFGHELLNRQASGHPHAITKTAYLPWLMSYKKPTESQTAFDSVLPR